MQENIKTITPIKVVSQSTFKPELRKKKVAAYELMI